MISILFGLVLLFLILILYMFYEAHLNIVKKHEFSFSDIRLKKPLRIFFISDIHRRKIHHSILEKVNGKVDLVIIGGDLLEKGVPLQRINQNIQKLRSLGPVYFVWGNNDKEINEQILLSIFQKWDVQVLKNSSTISNDRHNNWALIGVDDMNTGHIDLEGALQEVKDIPFKILISHDPRVIKYVQREHKISLILSGHTHGGQIRIVGFGPYEKGKTHIDNGITQIISNGYGTTAVPLRLDAKPETHYIIINSF